MALPAISRWHCHHVEIHGRSLRATSSFFPRVQRTYLWVKDRHQRKEGKVPLCNSFTRSRLRRGAKSVRTQVIGCMLPEIEEILDPSSTEMMCAGHPQRR